MGTLFVFLMVIIWIFSYFHFTCGTFHIKSSRPCLPPPSILMTLCIFLSSQHSYESIPNFTSLAHSTGFCCLGLWNIDKIEPFFRKELVLSMKNICIFDIYSANLMEICSIVKWTVLIREKKYGTTFVYFFFIKKNIFYKFLKTF